MSKIPVTINGKPCEAEPGQYLLDVAMDHRIGIPHLCHHQTLKGLNSCRLCVVEVEENGRNKIVTSCTYPVTREITVKTNTEKLKKMRRVLLSLLKAQAPMAEHVDKMIKAFGTEDGSRYEINDKNACVLCGLCVKACEEVGCSAISMVNRGITKKVATPYEVASDSCIGCGSCAYVCPTDCISVKEEKGVRTIWNKDFQLLQCSSCGAYFSTAEQYQHVHGTKPQEGEALLCERCKKEEYARRMISVYNR